MLVEPQPRICQVRELGRIPWREASVLQRSLVDERAAGAIPDQILFAEHPHVITLGRNASESNILVDWDLLRRAGIEIEYANRGGDVTYHGPGQLICYPIFDLRDWKRDVRAYVRALEAVVIDVLAELGLQAASAGDGDAGVWISGAKIAAIGVHISRWVSSHGFALNVRPDLRYFRYINPCGTTKPVTSLYELGIDVPAEALQARILAGFAKAYTLDIAQPVPTTETLS